MLHPARRSEAAAGMPDLTAVPAIPVALIPDTNITPTKVRVHAGHTIAKRLGVKATRIAREIQIERVGTPPQAIHMGVVATPEWTHGW